MQGITLGYGGNPYGPAGTGKTESVKALGQALARQVFLLLLVCMCWPKLLLQKLSRHLLTLALQLVSALMSMQCMQLVHAASQPAEQLKPL